MVCLMEGGVYKVRPNQRPHCVVYSYQTLGEVRTNCLYRSQTISDTLKPAVATVYQPTWNLKIIFFTKLSPLLVLCRRNDYNNFRSMLTTIKCLNGVHNNWQTFQY